MSTPIEALLQGLVSATDADSNAAKALIDLQSAQRKKRISRAQSKQRAKALVAKEKEAKAKAAEGQGPATTFDPQQANVARPEASVAQAAGGFGTDAASEIAGAVQGGRAVQQAAAGGQPGGGGGPAGPAGAGTTPAGAPNTITTTQQQLEPRMGLTRLFGGPGMRVTGETRTTRPNVLTASQAIEAEQRERSLQMRERLSTAQIAQSQAELRLAQNRDAREDVKLDLEAQKVEADLQLADASIEARESEIQERLSRAKLLDAQTGQTRVETSVIQSLMNQERALPLGTRVFGGGGRAGGTELTLTTKGKLGSRQIKASGLTDNELFEQTQQLVQVEKGAAGIAKRIVGNQPIFDPATFGQLLTLQQEHLNRDKLLIIQPESSEVGKRRQFFKLVPNADQAYSAVAMIESGQLSREDITSTFNEVLRPITIGDQPAFRIADGRVVPNENALKQGGGGGLSAVLPGAGTTRRAGGPEDSNRKMLELFIKSARGRLAPLGTAAGQLAQ